MLLLIPLSLCAQRRERPMRIGVICGVWGPRLNFSSADERWGLKSKLGYHLGFAAGWYGENFSLLPEFVYGQATHTLRREGGESSDLRISTGDLAVMAGWHAGVFGLEAGPTFSVLGKTASSGSEATLFRPMMGYAVRVGVSPLPRLSIYVGYGGNFNRSTLSIIEELPGGGTEQTDLSPSAVQWSAGVRILF